MTDEAYMRQALALARQGRGWTSPNPMVGAVIVKDGRIIGQGYHEKYGQLHAERNALAHCTESPRGATIYVTLEPCCHTGKQPPCVDAILENGLGRVVVGSSDPNPLVAGKGIERLRAQGVQVDTGVLQDECDRLNDVFFHFIQTKMPYVVLKYAMTMDGKIATYTGASKWITGEKARERVHADRSRYCSILVGVGTVLADDPMLNCRIEGGRDPIRIVCDTNLRTPLTAQLVQTAHDIPTILATCCTDPARHAAYEAAGCRVLVLPEDKGHVSLPALLTQLGQESIDSVYIEGGATIHAAAMESGLVSKVQTYLAPKLFGGRDAPSPIGGQGVALPAQAVQLQNSTITQLGDDILIESEVKHHVHRDC